ncbi:MAG: FAD-dependent oxidoreductase, partial [Myxococcota bacterium]
MPLAGYEELGLWLATLPEPLEPQAALAGDERADVAGFGASGRNGGWCTGSLAGIEGLLSRPERRER